MPPLPPAAPTARRRAPGAWGRAALGLLIGALPGVAFVVAARGALNSDGLWPILAVGTLLYFLSLPLAAWQFGRRARLGLAWGYVAGVVVTTGVVLALLLTTGALF
jgi:hypothetical protein